MDFPKTMGDAEKLPGATGEVQTNMGKDFDQKVKALIDMLRSAAMKELREHVEEFTSECAEEARQAIGDLDVEGAADLIGDTEVEARKQIRAYQKNVDSWKEKDLYGFGLRHIQDNRQNKMNALEFAHLVEHGNELRTSTPVWRPIVYKHYKAMKKYERTIYSAVARRLSEKILGLANSRFRKV